MLQTPRNIIKLLNNYLFFWQMYSILWYYTSEGLIEEFKQVQFAAQRLGECSQQGCTFNQNIKKIISVKCIKFPLIVTRAAIVIYAYCMYKCNMENAVRFLHTISCSAGSGAEPREKVGSFPFHTHQFTCTPGRPVCVFPDVDNQHISVTERAADHEGIGPRFRPRSPDKIQGASP